MRLTAQSVQRRAVERFGARDMQAVVSQRSGVADGFEQEWDAQAVPLPISRRIVAVQQMGKRDGVYFEGSDMWGRELHRDFAPVRRFSLAWCWAAADRFAEFIFERLKRSFFSQHHSI